MRSPRRQASPPSSARGRSRCWRCRPATTSCSGRSPLSLFDDGFRLRWWHVALWLVLVIAGTAACFLSSPPLGLALTLSSFAFAVLAMAQAVTSWRADLVEGRRRLRLFVVGASSLYIGLMATAQLAGLQRSAPEGTSLGGAAGLLAIAGIVAWSLLGVGGTQSLFAVTADLPRPVEEPAAPSVEPADQQLVANLERLMTTEQGPSPGRPHHRQPGAAARPAGIPPAAADQPGARLPELQQFRQSLPHRRGQGGAGRPRPGRRPGADHRPRRRLQLARPVQSRLQGRNRRHAQRISAVWPSQPATNPESASRFRIRPARFRTRREAIWPLTRLA